MRILLIAMWFMNYASLLANALSEKHEVTIMFPTEQLEIKPLGTKFCSDNLLNEKVNVVLVPKPRLSDPRNLSMVYKFIKEVHGIRPDIIHIHSSDLWVSFGLMFLRSYPIVYTLHDPVSHSGEKTLHGELAKRFMLKYSDRIFVHGKKLKRMLIEEKRVKSEKISVVPHGEYSFFRKWEKPVSERDGSILFFGRVKEYKGLEYLIKAEPMITKEVPNARIVIAGKGDDLKKYREMMKNPDNFKIHNYVIPNEKVAELFQEASVVVLPYIDASQSGIIPIAYAFKKPVVATNVGSIPEVVDEGQTGIIVPPRNPEKLAEAVVSLLKDKEKRLEMGEKAYMKMKNELSWDKIAEKTVEVYEEARIAKPRR